MSVIGSALTLPLKLAGKATTMVQPLFSAVAGTLSVGLGTAIVLGFLR